MIPCLLQMTARFVSYEWVLKRPYITQEFGERPDVYKQFDMKGHNGLDYRASIGTPIFSPIEGKAKVKKNKNGYGHHIKIRNKYGKEVVLAHLSEFYIKDGEHVYQLQKVGLTGNTGFSSGPHLHYGFRELIVGKGDIYKWKVKNYNNGYFGYLDPLPFTFTWKGTHLNHNL